MASVDGAQGFMIAADVKAQLSLIDANASVALANAKDDEERKQIHNERDQHVNEVVGGAIVGGGFVLVSLGGGIKQIVATSRAGGAFKVREPVAEIATHGRAKMQDTLASDTFPHESERVKLTDEERSYLEHEVATPGAAKDTHSVAHADKTASEPTSKTAPTKDVQSAKRESSEPTTKQMQSADSNAGDSETPAPKRNVNADAPNVGDPTRDRWVGDLKSQLSAEDRRRLDLISHDKDSSQIFEMFHGDVAIAKAKIYGSNLTPELLAKRAGLSPKAQRAFDDKWNTIVGDDRNPSTAKVKAFEGYIDAMEKRGGGRLTVGLEAEEAKLSPSKVVAEPKAADFPKSWDVFNPVTNREFKTELENFRGTDDMEQNFAGGEGAVYLGQRKTTALKRWFAKRTDMPQSLAKLRAAHDAVSGDLILSNHLLVVEVRRTAADWIERDFVMGSRELKEFATGPAEVARVEVIKKLESKPVRSAAEEDILGKLRNRSANLHWDSAQSKIVIIDMQ